MKLTVGEKNQNKPTICDTLALTSSTAVQFLDSVSNKCDISIDNLWFSNSFKFNNSTKSNSLLKDISCDRLLLRYETRVLDLVLHLVYNLRRRSALPCIFCLVEDPSELVFNKLLTQLQQIQLRTQFQILLNESYDVSNLKFYQSLFNLLLKHINQSKISQFTVYSKHLAKPLIELDLQNLILKFEFNNRDNILVTMHILRSL